MFHCSTLLLDAAPQQGADDRDDHDFDDFGCGVDGPGSAMGGGGTTRAEHIAIKRMTVECLRNETIARCTVLLPMVKLPNDVETKVWCMYHCKYSCPCSDYKNPLEYGPDKCRSRNVGRRTGATKFKTTKQQINPISMSTPKSGTPASATASDSRMSNPSRRHKRKLVTSIVTHDTEDMFDIAPDDLPSLSSDSNPTSDSQTRKIKIQKVNGRYIMSPTASTPLKYKVRKNRSEHNFKFHPTLSGLDFEAQCARTSGLVVRTPNQTRMPHKVVVKKKKRSLNKHQQQQPYISDEDPLEVDPKVDGIRPLQHIVATKIFSSKRSPCAADEAEAPAKKLPTAEVDRKTMPKSIAAMISSTLTLTIKPKGKKQYVKWGLIKEGLDRKQVKLWFCFKTVSSQVLTFNNHVIHAQ